MPDKELNYQWTKEKEEYIASLRKELESYKALDSHYDEIEEDAKRIAEENEELKAKINAWEKGNPIGELLADKEDKIAELEKEIKQMKDFVKSLYEANKGNAYCREYLGTILNEWEIKYD